MQQSPKRVKTRFTDYNVRTKRRHVTEVGTVDCEDTREGKLKRESSWVRTVTCNCCTLPTANHRRWQKRLSKTVTLRSHRD